VKKKKNAKELSDQYKGKCIYNFLEMEQNSIKELARSIHSISGAGKLNNASQSTQHI
jgi:hypothetical protein